jgi:antitoxin (DNA-binding transcriptional repressor) of toxin-antitoxin stability system
VKIVNMHEANTTLSALVREVRNGIEPEIVIAIDGAPAAKLVPYGPPPRRVLGVDQGLVRISDDFDAPNADIAALFESK